MEVRLPRISVFYGIAIYMYYRDHAPPHFHALYGEFEATVSIETGDLLEGRLPRRARSLVSEWVMSHRDEFPPCVGIGAIASFCPRSTG